MIFNYSKFSLHTTYVWREYAAILWSVSSRRTATKNERSNNGGFQRTAKKVSYETKKSSTCLGCSGIGITESPPRLGCFLVLRFLLLPMLGVVDKNNEKTKIEGRQTRTS